MSEILEGDGVDPNLIKIKQFLDMRKSAAPVETYEELQLALRGYFDLPRVLVEYVKENGEEAIDYKDNSVSRLGVKAGKFLVKAEAQIDAYNEDSVTIISSKRMFPLMRYKATSLVTLHAVGPRWDQAVLYRPKFDAFRPEVSSPEAIDFWASKGEQAIFGDDSGRPTSTTGQLARRASAEAFDTFNGFLNTTVWLVDNLVHGEKIR